MLVSAARISREAYGVRRIPALSIELLPLRGEGGFHF